MALVIEDGTGVLNANSYGDVAGARAYATDRGVTLDASNTVVESQMHLAMDYLESLSYQGAPQSFTQPLSWPRKELEFDPDNPVPLTYIPPALVQAQFQLVIEQANGIVIQPSSSGAVAGASGAVVEEKTDVLTTRYSERIGTTIEPIMPKVKALLRGLVLPTPVLRTVRM